MLSLQLRHHLHSKRSNNLCTPLLRLHQRILLRITLIHFLLLFLTLAPFFMIPALNLIPNHHFVSENFISMHYSRVLYLINGFKL